MTSTQIKEINGNRYAYRVEYIGDNQHEWEYLGPASQMNSDNLTNDSDDDEQDDEQDQQLYDPDKVPEDMFGQWRSFTNEADVGDTVEIEYDMGGGRKETYAGEITTKLDEDENRTEDEAAEKLPQTPNAGWKHSQVVVDGRIWVRPDSPQTQSNSNTSLIVSDGDMLIGHGKTGSLDDISLS